MEENKNTLLIDDIKYEVPQMVINSIGQENFDKLNNPDTSLEINYLILTKLDIINTNYIGLVVDQDTFNERKTEIADYAKDAFSFAKVNKLDEANGLLKKSIKAYLDIYNDTKEMGVKK